jgi:hypothetical protein
MMAVSDIADRVTRRPSGESRLSLEERTQRRIERRNKKRRERPRDEAELVNFTHELTWLSQRYARFGPELLKLRQFVYMQLRSPGKKKAAVMVCFASRETVLDLEEVMEEANLDRVSATIVIAALEHESQLEQVTRDGRRPRVTKDGRYTDHVYYRRVRC